MADMGMPVGQRKPSPVRRTWRPLSEPLERRVQAVLDGWHETPYINVPPVRGRGANCVGLVAGAFDELFRRAESSYLPRLAPDSGIHLDGAGEETVKALRDMTGARQVKDGSIEPGDIVTSYGESPSSPEREAHVLIAGYNTGKPWGLLHAYRAARKVVWTSVGVMNLRIIAVYRTPNKEVWL